MTQLANFQYDIFQRYLVLSRALETAFPVRNKPVRVLDLGSGPASLTPIFLPHGFEVTSADVDKFGNDSIILIERGKPLPFEDGAFDAIVCMDVLEHIPAAQHDLYLAEMARVAGKLIVLAFPHDAANVKEGEKLLDRGYLTLWGARCEFLVEHEEFGLPRHASVASRLERAGCSCATLGISPLPEWLLYSYLDLLALKLFGVGPEKDEVNRRFNAHVAVGREPEGFYRAMIIASRSPRLVAQLEKSALQHRADPEARAEGPFELPTATFDAFLALVDRLKKKSYEEVHATVAGDLARLSAPALSAESLAPLHTGLEGATRALTEMRQALAERDQLGATAAQLGAALAAAKEYRESLDLERDQHRETRAELDRMKDVQRHVVIETSALSDQIKSLSDTLAKQVQMHEFKLNEMNALLEQRDSALDDATGALADAQQQRDANAENVKSLAAALQRQIEVHETDVRTLAASLSRQAELHEVKVRELEGQVRQLTELLAAENAALASARREHETHVAEAGRKLADAVRRRDKAESSEEAIRDELRIAKRAAREEVELARREVREAQSALEAERSAGQKRVARAELLLDSHKVELGRAYTRLRCEKRARLVDLKRLESLSRPH